MLQNMPEFILCVSVWYRCTCSCVYGGLRSMFSVCLNCSPLNDSSSCFFPLPPLLYFFKTVSHWTWSLPVLLDWQSMNPRGPLSSLLSAGIICVRSSACFSFFLFYVYIGAGDWTQVLILVWQPLYRLGHLSNSTQLSRSSLWFYACSWPCCVLGFRIHRFDKPCIENTHIFGQSLTM